MIITEIYDINGRSFTRTTSDAGREVVRDGISYEEAIDPTELGRTYTEGDYIEGEETAEDIIDILLGEKP